MAEEDYSDRELFQFLTDKLVSNKATPILEIPFALEYTPEFLPQCKNHFFFFNIYIYRYDTMKYTQQLIKYVRRNSLPPYIFYQLLRIFHCIQGLVLSVTITAIRI